jgi:multicomponent Na+:H+ antiporter subunit B
MIGRHSSDNTRVVGTFVVPFVIMFGFYVTFHGHYGPGGGFAGGVILAVAVIIVRMTAPVALSQRIFPPGVAFWVMLSGVALFVAIGLAAIVAGGTFLDYDALPLPGDIAKQRYYGILAVEIGVGATVAGAMVYIVDLVGSAGRKP